MRAARSLTRESGTVALESRIEKPLRTVSSGQKEGGPPTPKRPAIAFLVTPKTPARRGKSKISNTCMLVSRGAVNRNFRDFSAWLRTEAKSLLASEMDETILHRVAPAARLRVAGSDAATFLQGQFSNDLRRTEARPATYGLWLNHKGRALADSHVLQRGPNDFEVISRTSPGAAIRERLETYIIADDVVVEDCGAGCDGVVLAGVGATDLVNRLGFDPIGPRVFAETGDRIALPARWGAGPAWYVIGSADSISSAIGELERVGTRALDAAGFARRRIEVGIVTVPDELGPDDLPMEGGLEHDAVSLTKGCYLGQEVMARLHNLGQVRRRLFVVAFDASTKLPPRGAPLFSGAQKVGELRAAVPAASGDGALGLAMLQMHAVQPGAMLSVGAGEPAAVRVECLAEGRTS